MKSFAVIDAVCLEVIEGKNVVVFHSVLVTIVVILAVMRDIVRRIDVDLAVKNMCRRVCCKNMSYKWRSFFHSRILPFTEYIYNNIL